MLNPTTFMRILAEITRVLVGIEFVFSGFVKVVDPYGTGLKLQEYFEVFAEDLPALSGVFELIASQSQFLSLVFCAGELILGIALLLKFRMPITASIAFLLMAFFTFLTFYSAYFNKVTDCGCFGDFLKLKPWTSFWKDAISILAIGIIYLYRKKYNEWAFALPIFSFGVLVSFSIGIYAKMFLPVLDFLPYAKGKSILEQMQPTGIKPLIEYLFLDKETNKEIEASEFLMDTTRYTYVSSKILNEDAIRPKITDYSISDNEGNDVTTESLTNTKVILCLKYLDGISTSQFNELSELSKHPNAMVITSMFLEDVEPSLRQKGINCGLYNIDEKVLKTMARTNPCVILLSNGVVQEKWSHLRIPSIEKVNSIIKP